MKKFFAILTAVVMLLTLALPVMAADTGKINVTNALEGQVYSIYKMADLEDYDADKDAYLYTPVAEWADFFAEYPDNFKLENGYIIYDEDPELDVAAFAKAALEYAEDNSIDAIASEEAGAEALVFDGLALGYYLVDSNLGALCALTTTAPEANVSEKNAKPETDKEVEEDSLVDNGIADDEWGKENDADTFQTINYRTTITVEKGAENYVLHDIMEPGLTFTGITSVTVNGANINYTLKDENNADNCTFEMTFDNDYIATLTPGTEIIVAYTAVLNENAVIAGEGNDNKTWLDYGENNHTTPVITTTYTYEFDLIKTDSADVLLDGAEFKLYKADGTTPFYFLKDAKGYYIVDADTEGATDTLVVTNGKITVRGLDSDNYALEETEAPAGYNKLTANEAFEIDGANLNATIENTKYVDGGVRIINKTGTELPGTGGMGTTLFIVIGGMIVLAAGVVLVSKKRMSKIAD